MLRRASPWAIAAAAALVVMAIGALDYAQTQDVAECGPGDNPCFDARRRIVDGREAGFGDRAWIYALGVLLAAAGAAALDLRDPALAGGRRRVFARLGSAGVLALGVAALVLMQFASAGTEYPNRDLIFFAPALCMLGGAAIGGIAFRLRGERRPRARPRLGALSLVALGLAVLGLVLAMIWAGQVDCGEGGSDAVGSAGGIAGVAALACAFVGLFRGAWVVALGVLAIDGLIVLVFFAEACLN